MKAFVIRNKSNSSVFWSCSDEWLMWSDCTVCSTIEEAQGLQTDTEDEYGVAHGEVVVVDITIKGKL